MGTSPFVHGSPQAKRQAPFTASCYLVQGSGTILRTRVTGEGRGAWSRCPG